MVKNVRSETEINCKRHQNIYIFSPCNSGISYAFLKSIIARHTTAKQIVLVYVFDEILTRPIIHTSSLLKIGVKMSIRKWNTLNIISFIDFTLELTDAIRNKCSTKRNNCQLFLLSHSSI